MKRIPRHIRAMFALALWLFSMTLAVSVHSESLQINKASSHALYSITDSFSYTSTQNLPNNKDRELRPQVICTSLTAEQTDTDSEQRFHCIVTGVSLSDASSLHSQLVYTETTSSRL